MWSLAVGLLTKIPGLAQAFLDWQVKKSNIDLEAFKTATGYDVAAYQAYISGHVEIMRIRLAANAWWGAKLIILVSGGMASLHFAAIMLDSIPFRIPMFMETPHAVGSWGVPRPPAPYDAYQKDILMSFFILAPVTPLIGAFSQWLGRKH